MEVDPHDKSILDYQVDKLEAKRTWRGWILWLTILVVSLCALFLFNNEFVTGWLGLTFAIGGVLGVFLFLAFLSTKPFGHGDSTARWWWMR